MAIPANTVETFDQIGRREDLSDILSNIAPTDTPFQTAIGGGSISNTLFEWQTDDLAAADATNARIQGNDAVLQASDPTVRLNNQTQISDKTAVISGTAQAMDLAGRTTDLARILTNKTKELKRDMEKILVGAGQAKTAGSSGTASKTANVASWIATNIVLGATGSAPTGDGSDVATPGTAVDFAETQIETVVDAVFTEGGDANMLMVNVFNKRALNAFVGRATNIDDLVTAEQIVNAVDVYKSDFGTLQIVTNRFSDPATAYILDTSLWELKMLRPLFSQQLALTGDNEKHQMLVEYGLQSTNEKGSGIIHALTTS